MSGCNREATSSAIIDVVSSAGSLRQFKAPSSAGASCGGAANDCCGCVAFSRLLPLLGEESFLVVAVVAVVAGFAAAAEGGDEIDELVRGSFSFPVPAAMTLDIVIAVPLERRGICHCWRIASTALIDGMAVTAIEIGAANRSPPSSSSLRSPFPSFSSLCFVFDVAFLVVDGVPFLRAIVSPSSAANPNKLSLSS